MNFRIDSDLVEKGRITKGTEQFALQYCLKVYDLFSLVVKTNAKRVWSFNFKGDHTIDGVAHPRLPH